MILREWFVWCVLLNPLTTSAKDLLSLTRLPSPILMFLIPFWGVKVCRGTLDLDFRINLAMFTLKNAITTFHLPNSFFKYLWIFYPSESNESKIGAAQIFLHRHICIHHFTKSLKNRTKLHVVGPNWNICHEECCDISVQSWVWRRMLWFINITKISQHKSLGSTDCLCRCTSVQFSAPFSSCPFVSSIPFRLVVS